jgi:ABC-type dipeptide/oligopeptide/nickel transport system permease subunit
MLANAQSNLETAWWAAVFPGLAILVTVLAINYIGDGLRDALDPNMG